MVMLQKLEFFHNGIENRFLNGCKGCDLKIIKIQNESRGKRFIQSIKHAILTREYFGLLGVNFGSLSLNKTSMFDSQ